MVYANRNGSLKGYERHSKMAHVHKKSENSTDPENNRIEAIKFLKSGKPFALIVGDVDENHGAEAIVVMKSGLTVAQNMIQALHGTLFDVIETTTQTVASELPEDISKHLLDALEIARATRENTK